MKISLYPHGGSGNHGCEAIIRSTISMIPNCMAKLFSSSISEDTKYNLTDICDIFHDKTTINRFSLPYISAVIKRYIGGDKQAYDKLVFSTIFKESKWADYAISIGGDNYCYGVPEFIYLINSELRKRKIKTILWGCSINPDSIDDRMLTDLKSYTHIFARESLTYNALSENKLTNISLYPDPAFILPRIDKPLPEGFIKGNTVGINISPLILKGEQKEGIIFENYVNVIDHIIRNTTMNIALIPHVVQKNNDDRTILISLYNKFRNTKRVIMIEDDETRVLKGYIARCRFVIAARTHASIAAYSEQVPTIVIGYSIKALGIAKDIFGSHMNFVIKSAEISDKNDILNCFNWLCNNEDNIKQTYKAIMPEYKSRAKSASQKLLSL